MHAVGVDIGGTKIAAGVVAEDGTIVAQSRRDTSPRDAAGIDRAIAEVVAEFAADYEFAAVGLAAAGFVSANQRDVVFGPNIPAWRDYPLADKVTAQIGRDDIAVVVENDGNAAGWAEYEYGAGKGSSNMVLLTIGTGIGAAIIVDGAMVRGAYGFAAELGHVRVVPEGHLCGCGKHGCWEQYASGSALVREARTAALSSATRAGAILDIAGGDVDLIKGPHITQAAQAGDPLAKSLLADVGTWVGEGCASLAAILDPNIYVVGGGVIAAGELLLESARDAYARHVPANDYRPEVPIVAAHMGNDAGIVGAAALARTSLAAAG